MDWGTIIVVALLILIVVFAIFSGRKHFKGEGGCCGGSDEKPEKKKIKEPVVAKKIITIDGMHCEHCVNSVTKHINKIDGVAAKVSLKKKTATVIMSRDISNQELQNAVENAGFTIVQIETEAI